MLITTTAAALQAHAVCCSSASRLALPLFCGLALACSPRMAWCMLTARRHAHNNSSSSLPSSRCLLFLTRARGLCACDAVPSRHLTRTPPSCIHPVRRGAFQRASHTNAQRGALPGIGTSARLWAVHVARCPPRHLTCTPPLWVVRAISALHGTSHVPSPPAGLKSGRVASGLPPLPTHDLAPVSPVTAPSRPPTRRNRMAPRCAPPRPTDERGPHVWYLWVALFVLTPLPDLIDRSMGAPSQHTLMCPACRDLGAHSDTPRQPRVRACMIRCVQTPHA